MGSKTTKKNIKNIKTAGTACGIEFLVYGV
jgi:hypothetical protein